MAGHPSAAARSKQTRKNDDDFNADLAPLCDPTQAGIARKQKRLHDIQLLSAFPECVVLREVSKSLNIGHQSSDALLALSR